MKVYVGLSGGVDSAVSAALLKDAGYDVTGVFIKIWSPEFLECTWREDRLDAMRVAVHLQIPFKEIDLSEEYKQSVVRDMIDNYSRGITPNPDVLCNRTIKFGAFAKWAFKDGADLIATGHYARIRKNGSEYSLLKGVDPAKDQSYFLYRLTQEDLSRALFPVGGFSKPIIRDKARAYKLPNASRPDSQGLCFVGDISMQEFLSRFMHLEKGNLLDENAVHVGTHDGAALYTIGQRHGFHLSPNSVGPYFVTKIDVPSNTVHVSTKRTSTEHRSVDLIDVHWIGGSMQSVQAVPCYHGKGVSARVQDSRAEFDVPLQVTPGQSLVFYQEDICLGGAVIANF